MELNLPGVTSMLRYLAIEGALSKTLQHMICALWNKTLQHPLVLLNFCGPCKWKDPVRSRGGLQPVHEGISFGRVQISGIRQCGMWHVSVLQERTTKRSTRFDHGQLDEDFVFMPLFNPPPTKMRNLANRTQWHMTEVSERLLSLLPFQGAAVTVESSCCIHPNGYLPRPNECLVLHFSALRFYPVVNPASGDPFFDKVTIRLPGHDHCRWGSVGKTGGRGGGRPHRHP
ncbi:hypothetical protein C8F04DRAFT_1178899 [Mycena alexandri]|uniref:Uncharacterized protein n=1 Tax=Mycena alexandri TaxID=1745969 RepID=A0AAD6T3X6_9AGAR|nr:hypothetical protein C8F04DRAFT_1178899 [Mycena alexandri]